jgi:hypothetical protein
MFRNDGGVRFQDAGAGAAGPFNDQTLLLREDIPTAQVMPCKPFAPGESPLPMTMQDHK